MSAFDQLLKAACHFHKNLIERMDVSGSPQEMEYLATYLDEIPNKCGNVQLPAQGTSAFYKLRNQVKKKLIRQLIQTDPERTGQTPRKQAHFQCQQLVLAIGVLLHNGYRDAGFDLARQVVKKAQKLSFTDILVQVGRTIRSTSLESAYPLPMDGLIPDLSTLERCLFWEDKLMETYCARVHCSTENRWSKPDFYESINHLLQTVRGLQTGEGSYRLGLYQSLLDVELKVFEGRLGTAANLCQTACNQLAEWPFDALDGRQMIVLKWAEVLFLQADLEAMEQLLVVEKNTFNPHTTAWIKCQEWHLRLALRKRQITKALEIFRSVQLKKCQEPLPPYVRETWLVLGAYITWVTHVNTRAKEAPTDIYSFRLGRFLNELPLLAQDKTGMNVSILILQFLLLLSQKKYNRIIDRMEAMAKYNNRYLRGAKHSRFHIFLKMLLEIPRNNFHKEAVLRKTKSLQQKLVREGKRDKLSTAELEILPLEHLWEGAIKALDNNTVADVLH